MSTMTGGILIASSLNMSTALCAFDGSKSRKTGILVEDLRRLEPNPMHQFKLVTQRTRGVFLLDVVKNLLAIIDASQRFQVIPIPFPHQFLNPVIFVGDKVCNPKRAPWFYDPVYFAKGRFPIMIITQMMKNGRSDDDIVAGVSPLHTSEIPMKNPNGLGCFNGNPFPGARQHGLAQIAEVAREIPGVGPQQTNGIVAGAASHIQYATYFWGDSHGGPCNQYHGQRRVDRSGLTGVKVCKTLNIGIKSAPDLLNR